MISELLTSIKEHPTVSGTLATLTTGGFSLIGLLTSESVVRGIACIGGALGILLTLMSMYHKYLQIRNERTN